MAVTRWGGSSWSLGYVGSVDERPVFTAEVLYVSVVLNQNVPMQTPEGIREAMGDATDILGSAAQ